MSEPCGRRRRCDWVIGLGLLLGGGALGLWMLLAPHTPPDPRRSADPPRSPPAVPHTVPVEASAAAQTALPVDADSRGSAATRPDLPARPALPPTAEAWWQRPANDRACDEFKAWTAAYLAGAPSTIASAETDGVRLARARRDQLEDLIETDPERALHLAVPDTVRSQLPTAVQALLEEPVRGRGDLEVLAVLPEPGNPGRLPPVYRRAVLGQRTYEAFVYGRRSGEPTRLGIPLHGVALHGRVAVAEDPARVLDPVESAARADAFSGATCPVGAHAAPDAADPPTATPTPVGLEVGAQLVLCCSTSHAADYLAELVQAESGAPATATIADPDPAPNVGLLATILPNAKRLLLIRVDFSDLAGAPFSDSTGTTLVNNLNAFYREMSYGKVGWAAVGAGSDVTRTFRMPQTAAYYGTNDAAVLRRDARSAATAGGYVLSRYDYDATCFGSVPGFAWAGLGYVGAPGIWLRNTFSTGVAGHELGHNLGLLHANFWDTAGQSVIGNGTEVEYGDKFDTMGSAGAGEKHFNARYKNYLGWLASSNVTTFTTNGTYRLHALDHTNLVGRLGLKISKNSSTNYWVEFRQRTTAYKWMMDGAGLRWAGNGNQSSKLLDTTPGSPDSKNDSALVIGRTFSDLVSGIHLTPIAKGSTTPESLDLVVYRGTFVANRAPTARVLASAIRTSPNSAVQLTAQATDADGDPLAYAWDFGDGNYGPNAAQATHAWTAAGLYAARCTVSDMKGGTATSSVLVQIGTPTTFALSGRITLENAPLGEVRVSVSTTKVAYTDSDGRYVLTGLSAGSYTLQAALEGYFFSHPAFANPVTIDSSREGLDFAAVRPEGQDLVTLVPAGATWRYRDDGSNQGTAWTALAFDDSRWNQGPAQFGYGDNDVTTTVSFGPEANAKFITTYFRHAFTVDDPARFLGLTLGLLRDDGGIVYLNGKEVFRSNLPTGTIGYRTLASATVGGAEESTFYPTDLTPTLLRAGRNVLAVEIHQVSATSSDLGFDLQLKGVGLQPLTPPTLAWALADGALSLRWPDTASSWQLQTTTDLANPTAWHAVSSASQVTAGQRVVAVTPSDTCRFFRLAKP